MCPELAKNTPSQNDPENSMFCSARGSNSCITAGAARKSRGRSRGHKAPRNGAGPIETRGARSAPGAVAAREPANPPGGRTSPGATGHKGPLPSAGEGWSTRPCRRGGRHWQRCCERCGAASETSASWRWTWRCRDQRRRGARTCKITSSDLQPPLHPTPCCPSRKARRTCDARTPC